MTRWLWLQRCQRSMHKRSAKRLAEWHEGRACPRWALVHRDCAFFSWLRLALAGRSAPLFLRTLSSRPAPPLTAWKSVAEFALDESYPRSCTPVLVDVTMNFVCSGTPARSLPSPALHPSPARVSLRRRQTALAHPPSCVHAHGDATFPASPPHRLHPAIASSHSQT